MPDLMTEETTHGNVPNGTLKDPTNLIPGITAVDKVNHSNGAAEEEPASFPGPQVNGRETTVTKFSPSQLAKSPLMPSLHDTINVAFREGHRSSGHLLVDRDRLRTDTQLLEELGNAPGTITFVVSYTGTEQVIATASGKRYLGRAHIVEKDLTQAEKWANTWKRFGLVESDTAAWELSTMAVDPTLQRQGLAGFLMRLVEEEVKRMFESVVSESGAAVKKLLLMITTIGERNFEFYDRRGFKKDYGTFYEAGWLGSTSGFTVIHMTKTVTAGNANK